MLRLLGLPSGGEAGRSLAKKLPLHPSWEIIKLELKGPLYSASCRRRFRIFDFHPGSRRTKAIKAVCISGRTSEQSRWDIRYGLAIRHRVGRHSRDDAAGARPRTSA